MDLDLGDVDTHVFRDKVRGILASRPFAQILAARAIYIDRATEHKQTDTTQRWKLALKVEGTAVPLPTKIEFSRRGLDEGVVFGSVDVDLARAYHLPPFLTVDFGMFKSQVLAYLPPDDQAYYDAAPVWDTIVLEVVDALRMGQR